MAMRIEEIRRGLCARLRARRAEIEQAAMTRVYAISDSSESADPEYTEGLRAAVGAALDYGIDAVERSEDRAPPIPTALLAQARLAARSGVKLETVLRRYLAGYTLLGDFLIEESARGGLLDEASLKRLLRALAGLFDRVIATVSEEYGRESEGRFRSPEQRQAERIRRLLAGELLDAPELGYDLSAHHLGVVAVGQGAGEALGEFAKALDRRLLLIRREEGALWAWLGSRRGFDPEQLGELAHRQWPAGVSVAIGEPGQGIAGWRLTHRQAKAALPVALRSGEASVRYAEVALLASILRDELLVASLQQLYLAPLEHERDGGEAARKTLRAYFAADRNVSSAAMALDMNRTTVASRLRAIEERIGRKLSSCAADLEAAMRLEAAGRAMAQPTDR